MSNKTDKQFLNRYFRSVYNKLEADALLFNRKLPHEALKGSENEKALEDILRAFLPSRYGIESNVLVIDRNGKNSRQCDIVIYDEVQYPRYFRKVYPIEIVHAVIEVKTQLTKQQVDIALENEASLRKLDFFPLLTNYWQTKTKTDRISHKPPIYCIFGYRSGTDYLSTFAKWLSNLPTQTTAKRDAPYASSPNPFIACSLDIGNVFCRGDNHVERWLAVTEDDSNEGDFFIFDKKDELKINPAKALFVFMETLWTMLEQSPRHPGFDIRSYLDLELGIFMTFNHKGELE